MKTHKLTMLVLAAFSTFAFYACLPEEDTNQDVDYQLLAEDASTTDNINSDAFRVVDNESRNGDESASVGKTGIYSWKSSIDTCAIVTLNTNGGNFPMTLTVDFGAGCTDGYGVSRKGKVIAVFSGRYTSSGTQVDVSFDNYHVNEHKVEGTKTITNLGRNTSGNLQFNVVDSNVEITKPNNGGVVTWESTRLHEWSDGEATIFWPCDDEYTITGTATGTASDGTPYGIRTEVGKPAVTTVCCPYITSGTLVYSVNGSDVASLDFGTTAVPGLTCDPTATFAFNGQSIVIVVQ